MAAILDTEGYKALRGITDAGRDAQIAAALPAVEDAIARYIERDITTDPVTETRKYRYEGPIVNIDDAIAVNEVKIDEMPLVADTHYTVEPYDRSQPFYYLDLGATVYRPPSPLMGFKRNEDVLGRRGFQFVTVTAEWGWPDPKPASLKMAVALLVDELAPATATQRGISAESVADTSIVYESPESANSPPVLPPAVEQLVNPFRRIVL
jgi:hypothetical protein